MGRVFTPEQVRDGKYPIPGQQEDAAHRTMHILRQLVGVGELEFGAIYGSVGSALQGEDVSYGVRSDLDVFGIISKKRLTLPGVLLKFIDQINIEDYVGIEPHFWPGGTPHFFKPFTSLDPLFALHIAHLKSQKIAVGRNPFEDLTPAEITPQQALFCLDDYLSYKYNSFFKAACGERGPKEIQRILELPKSVARKALAAIKIIQPDLVVPHAADGVSNVRTLHSFLASNPEYEDTAGRYYELALFDTRYTKVLDTAINTRRPGDLVAHTELYRHYTDVQLCQDAIALTLSLRKVADDLRNEL